MTVKEYVEKLQTCNLHPMESDIPSFPEAMMSITQLWNDCACRGYAIMAMKEAELDRKTIERVIRAMDRIFNYVSVDQAEQYYYDSPV